MRSSRFTVISLGGDVQSSVMSLMANEGAFDRIPDCAIFADTRWEPLSTYEHLTWLRDRLSFPLYVVDNGRSLREDMKALTNHSGSRNYVDIPVYLKGGDEEGDAMGRRQCTDNYKIRPHQTQDTRAAGSETPAARPRRNHHRAVARHLHRRGHTHEDLPRPVDDEPLPSNRGGHAPQRLPELVEGALRQAAGTLGLRRLPLPVPAAVGGDKAQSLPRPDRGWPELFAEAVEIDARLRDGLALDKTPYLHTMRMPLAEAVALDQVGLGADGQRDGFGNECEGHCGV